MKKPLASFRYLTRQTVAHLDKLKSIVRVSTPRTLQWWLVLPAVGDADAVCILLRKVPKTPYATAYHQPQVIAEETARASA